MQPRPVRSSEQIPLGRARQLHPRRHLRTDRHAATALLPRRGGGPLLLLWLRLRRKTRRGRGGTDTRRAAAGQQRWLRLRRHGRRAAAVAVAVAIAVAELRMQVSYRRAAAAAAAAVVRQEVRRNLPCTQLPLGNLGVGTELVERGVGVEGGVGWDLGWGVMPLLQLRA